MLNKNDLVLNTTETKILYGIYEILQEIKTLLQPATREQVEAANLESLKRNDLMSLIKALPEKPEGWSKLPNPELIKLLKEGA
jgi:hypothetical protein